MAPLNMKRICSEFLRRVDDLVGHDLPPEQTARLQEHARVCERCAKEWRASLERAAALQTLTPWALEAAGVRPPSAGKTADAVFARLAAGEGLPRWRDRWIRPAALAAAAVLLASVGVYSSKFVNNGGDLNMSGNSASENSNANIPVANVNVTQDPPLQSDERVVDPIRRKMLLESALPGGNHRSNFAPFFINNAPPNQPFSNQQWIGPLLPADPRVESRPRGEKF